MDQELLVGDKLDTLTAKAKEIGKEEGDDNPPDGKKKPEEVAELSPDYVTWQAENKWFGNAANKDDKERSDNLIKIAKKLREEKSPLKDRPFMDKFMEILEEQERGYSRPRSKVETGGRTGGEGRGRAFDNLPKDAKDVCHGDNGAFVGPGKMFKTVKEWEDHYANLYGKG